MIKVIEHGYRYHMETRCPNCGCRFSYDWEDVITEQTPFWEPKITSNGYTYYRYTYPTTNPKYSIKCPECYHIFEILNWNLTIPKDNYITTWTFKTDTKENEEDSCECKCKKN